MPSDEIVGSNFSDWKAGPWHSLGPDKGPAKGRRYDCINMQVYQNGSLGPRPCLLENGGTGFTETLANFDGAVHFHQDFIYDLAYSNKNLLIFDGATTVRNVDIADDSNAQVTITTAGAINTQAKHPRYSASPQTKIGTLSHVPIATGGLIYGGLSYITAIGSSATNITQPTDWSPHTIISHRDRYWSWGDASNANRIHYSIPGSQTNWTDADLAGYLDVGATPLLPIIGVWPMYDSLLIAMSNLRWYIFRFTDDPQFGEIRYIGTKRIPDFSVQAAQPGDSLLFLTKASGIVVVTPDSIDDVTLDYVKPTGVSVGDLFFLRAIENQEQNSVCLPYAVKAIAANSPDFSHIGDQSFDLVNGVWVRSLYWGVAAADFVPSVIDTFRASSSEIGLIAVNDTLGGDQWGNYVRPVTLNRPSNDNDTYSSGSEVAIHSSSSADRFSGELTLARWRSPEGDSGIVESVIFDIDYWKASGFQTPAFTVTADYESGGTEYLDQAIGSLDAGTLDATLTYTPERTRVVLNPAAIPAASSILIKIKGIKSVAFVNISVEMRVQSQDPLTSQGAS